MKSCQSGSNQFRPLRCRQYVLAELMNELELTEKERDSLSTTLKGKQREESQIFSSNQLHGRQTCSANSLTPLFSVESFLLERNQKPPH